MSASVNEWHITVKAISMLKKNAEYTHRAAIEVNIEGDGDMKPFHACSPLTEIVDTFDDPLQAIAAAAEWMADPAKQKTGVSLLLETHTE